MKQYILRLGPVYLILGAVFLLFLTASNRVITVMGDMNPVERQQIIVIDAGHGGEDGGATSCTGVLESQFNLALALRLNDLCHLLGYETKMIRTEDISVYTQGSTLAAKKASDLRQRVSIVNQTDNAILISIHQNTFSDQRYYGAQVFYAKTDGSRELAHLMQKSFSMLAPENTRQEKESSGVYLMQHVSKTAVLVECGFLSNPEEEARLRSGDYQKKLCCAIISALSAYIKA